MKFACGSQSPSNTRRGKIDWRTFAFIESNYWGRAIVTDQYKYVMKYISTNDFVPMGPDPTQLGREQLFDLVTDPFEITNLSEDFQYQTELELRRKQLWEKEEKLNQYPLSHHRSQETIPPWRNTLQQA